MDFTILYLFSGKHRDTSLAAQLVQLGKDRGVAVRVEEVDIEFGAGFDLSVEETRRHYLANIQKGMYDAVICTPPCSTYTRVRMANMRGPPPLRSRDFPYGFPWLSNRHKQEAELGTLLVDYTLEVAEMVGKAHVSRKGLLIRFFSEHPEDLGAVIREEDQWRLVPASMWQRPQWTVIQQQPGMFTTVFNQCCWGAPYRKPTRVVSNISDVARWGSNQWPSFDDRWNYLGPLQVCDCQISQALVKKSNAQSFATSGTSQYPPAMDAALALALLNDLCADSLSTLSSSAGTSNMKREQQKEVDGPEETEWKESKEMKEETKVTRQESKEAQEETKVTRQNGSGQPMKAYYKGKHRVIHDGEGLGSPGRFPPRRRKIWLNEKGVKVATRVKKTFLAWMARMEGKEKGSVQKCFWKLAGGQHPSSPFGDYLDEARREVDKELKGLGYEPDRKGKDRSTEINFRRMIAVLEAAGDEDVDFLKPMAEKGVSLGVDEEMPRTPLVFEEKSKWSREFVDYVLTDQFSKNYESAVENQKDIRRQVLEEVETGTIICMSEEEAKSKFKGRLAVAALGAVPKELGSDKVRMIHDGSYSVDVNRRIKVLDRLRFPLCDDAPAVLTEIEEEVSKSRETRFSMLYDISRAHKLIPIVEEDWGLQAFKLPDEDDKIYVHTRGTFGVASAAYYWQRVAACMVRWCHKMAGKELGVYHLLFADDGWIASVGSDFWKKSLFWLFCMELLEFPISWNKVRGSLVVQWIGYQLDIQNFSRGVSDKKVDWVVRWITRKLEEGGATGREMRSTLGRFSFVAGALHHVRPFLGPLFAWTTMIAMGTCTQFPDAVKILLRFIADQLRACSMQPAKRWPSLPTDVFRVDAKAESFGHQDAAKARWFSVELTRKTAPWAYVKGDPFRTISSLELVAVLVAVMVFAPKSAWKGSRAQVTITATTDNLGNTFVLQRFMSCKYPLSIVVMELACQLRRFGLEMDLVWAPRLQNIPADDLTNAEFSKFLPEKRLEVDFGEETRGGFHRAEVSGAR